MERTMTGLTMCAYELDTDLRIVAVDDGWSEFARENGAPELVPPPGPLGQPATACVGDPTSRMLFEQLFQRVLRTGRTVTVPIRCDAPALRRYLDLVISRRGNAGIRIETRLIRSEARPPMALLDQKAPRGNELLRMCGWCKRVDVAGRWCEVEEAVAALNLFERDRLPLVTHGMCPLCYRRVCGELDREAGEPCAGSGVPAA